MIHTDERFWDKHRLCPHALRFDVTNKIHLDFIVAASNLIANIYSIPAFADRHEILQQLNQIQSPNVIMDENKNELKQNSPMNKEYQEETILSQMPKLNDLISLQIKSHQLNIDDDSNFQIDCIVAMTNLRALNYEIEIAERSQVKQIVGNITPSIITTSAIVAGLMCLEIYKLCQGHNNIEYFKDTCLNLALPCIYFFEPSPPKQQKVFSRFYDRYSKIYFRFKSTSTTSLLYGIDSK